MTSPASHTTPTEQAKNWTVGLLSLMMVMVPALGSPTEVLLQDTLKSILVAFFALFAAFAFFWHQRQQAVTLHFHRLLYLPLGLMAYALGSMMWSHAYLGGVEAIRWLVLSLIFFLGVQSLTLNRVTYLLWGIHLGAVLASIWAALQFWFDVQFFSQGPNPASTFVNRNFLAEFLVASLPFSVFLLTRIKDKTSVFLLTFSLGFNGVVLMMTGTRSALVGALTLVVILPGIAWRYRNQIVSKGWRTGHCLALIAVLVSTIATLGAIHTHNPKVIVESGQGNAIDRAFKRSISITKASEYAAGSAISMRTQMWKATGRMILANPIAGVGAGAWEVQAPLYQHAGSQLETDYYAHNEFLQLLAEYGLSGWLFLISLFTYLMWASYKTWIDQSEEGRQEGPLRAFTLASLWVLLLVSNAGFPWRLATTGALLALNLSLLAASDVRLRTRPAFLSRAVVWQAPYPVWALWATGMGMAMAVYISQQAIMCEDKLIRAVKSALTITQSNRPNDPRWQRTKVEMLQLMQEGIAINPHYRKLTPIVADELASWGDSANAIWIWESVLASRPHIVAISINIARAYLDMGNEPKALIYYDRAARLQPTAPAVRALKAHLLIQAGRYSDAIQIIQERLDTDIVDNDLINAAYLIGRRANNWQLVIRALQLRIRQEPSEASKAWLHLGNIYSRADVHDEVMALQSYRAALNAVPDHFKDGVWKKIPGTYREKLQSTTPP